MNRKKLLVKQRATEGKSISSINSGISSTNLNSLNTKTNINSRSNLLNSNSNSLNLNNLQRPGYNRQSTSSLNTKINANKQRPNRLPSVYNNTKLITKAEKYFNMSTPKEGWMNATRKELVGREQIIHEYIPPTIEMKENQQLQMSPDMVQFYENYEKCQQKSGFLAVIKSFNPKLNQIQAFPVYAVLNQNTFSLYLNTNPKSVILSTRLDRILCLTQKYQSTFCFDIKTNDIDGDMLNQDLFSVCASSKANMVLWINSILEFKECELKLNSDDANNKLIIDFSQINRAVSTKNTLMAKKATTEMDDDELRDRRYENFHYIPIKNNPPNLNQVQLKGEVEKIKQLLEEGEIEKKTISEALESQLTKAMKISSDVRKKKEKIEELIEKKLNAERLKETKLIENSRSKSELNLVKQIAKKIKIVKQEEIKDYKKNFINKINEEKKKANDNAKKMMKKIQEQNKNKDYTKDCLNPKLIDFKDMEYINQLCMRFYGEHLKDECVKKENFCRYCCEQKVGIKFEKNLNECKEKCYDNLMFTKLQTEKEEDEKDEKDADR